MEKFKPQKMVGWFDAKQLASTGLRAVVSSLFGSYADKRETMASISEVEFYEEYSALPELWIDYISDTGDGFDSTFTMTKLLGGDDVTVVEKNQEKKLPRAKVLIFGGDQVYPTPTRELYRDRFTGPLEAAAPWVKGGPEADMFAVPGNHDWYDGLTNFVKIFCQKRYWGIWATKQNRSYFAIKLRENTWLWAIDIQLEADIDQPQLNYFNKVATERMNKGDKVILCTAEPSWVYHTSKKVDSTYKNLEFFEKKYIADKGLDQILILAGDLHHYARYARQISPTKTLHKITSGGGGAFLHPTHNLPDKLVNMNEGDFDLKTTYPDKKTSKKLAFGNFLFPFYNWSFGVFLAFIHLLMAWSLHITSSFDTHDSDIFDQIKKLGISNINEVYERLTVSFFHSPVAILLLLIFVFGFYKFCDVNSSKLKFIGALGFLHGLLHVSLMMLSLWGFTYFNHNVLKISGVGNMTIALCLESFFLGGGLAGVLTGKYLLICNLLFGIHDNEAFSSMKISKYKNFLRMHLKDNKLTIYPIGVKNSCRWKQSNETYITSDTVKTELIESPIIINLD